MDQTENTVANFIQKSFEILEKKEFDKIIEWMPNGKQFAIKDIEVFEEVILPRYFRHRNINSFIRQLNMYGFHKSRKEPTKNIFSHPNFLRGHPELLILVKRKIKSDQKAQENIPSQNMIQPNKENSEVLEKISFIQRRQPSKYFSQKPMNERSDNLVATQAEIMLNPSANSNYFLALKSSKSFNFDTEFSPLKSLLSKSYIMDYNPEIYMKIVGDEKTIRNDWDQFLEKENEEDDNVSINNEIENEKRVFENRHSGILLLETYNFLNQK